MEILFSLLIFTFCFLGLAVGVIFSRKPLSGSCGRKDPNRPLIVDGKEVEIECLCEATGVANACSRISEQDVSEALKKFRQKENNL